MKRKEKLRRKWRGRGNLRSNYRAIRVRLPRYNAVTKMKKKRYRNYETVNTITNE